MQLSLRVVVQKNETLAHTYIDGGQYTYIYHVNAMREREKEEW